MENLLCQWDLIKNRIKGKNISLFLDYDGTLAPIVEQPEDAIMSSEMRDMLSFISTVPGVIVSIISGRSIEDIARRVNIPEIIYVGNHGLQIRGETTGLKDFVPTAYQAVISEISGKLKDAVGRVDGVFAENKFLTLSCHYRLVSDENVSYVKSLFEAVVAPYVKAGQVYVVEGKKVLEVRPSVGWDKGKAVLWLLDRRLLGNNKEAISIYIGDDVTDIDAFKVLQDKGITVWVGTEPKFSTGYFLKDTFEVIEFLEKLMALLLSREEV